MQDSFIVRQELTLKEFLGSTLYYYFSGKILNRLFLLLLVLAILSLFLGPSVILNFATIISSITPIVMVFLAIILYTCFTCFFIYKSKPYLFKNVSYEFSHWGVVRNGDRTKFSKPWRDISKFKETKNFFLLYAGNTDFHIIQKRLFKSPNELNSFRDLLKDKVSY